VPEASAAITDAVFRPVRTGNAFEETVERLLDGIRLGVHGYGDRLPPERELAGRLGVSRVTVRDALRELAAAGYVETRRGRFGGTFVTYQPDPIQHGELTRTVQGMGELLTDALTFRRIVEAGAAETAARATLSRRQREELAASLAAVESADLTAYRQADTRLHLAVAEAAGSALLTTSVVEVRVHLVDLLNAIPMLERNLVHSNLQHAAIVRAILTGDPDRARQAMEEHVEGTAALLRGFLGDAGGVSDGSDESDESGSGCLKDGGGLAGSGGSAGAGGLTDGSGVGGRGGGGSGRDEPDLDTARP
jgi:DNA-binding FadR family transcriptional regulator